MKADADLRFICCPHRDLAERGRMLDAVVTQFLTTVRHKCLEFVELSKRYVDVIIPEGGHNSVAVDRVVARLKSLFA